MSKPKKKRMKFPWEFVHVLADQLDSESEGSEDEETKIQELEYQQEAQNRLREMDRITRNMDKEQYMDYSDCRQASFTYKKMKKFRDFVNLNAYIDMRPNDDILEILGFLCCEMVK
jgi:transcription initiation protein SPT3